MQTGERSEPPDLGETTRQSDERELVISHLQKLLLEREKTAQILQSQLNSITRSAGWTVFQKLWDVYERLLLRAFYSKVTSRLSTLNRYYTRWNGNHFTIKGADEAPSIKSDALESGAYAESLAMAKALLDRSRAPILKAITNPICPPS